MTSLVEKDKLLNQHSYYEATTKRIKSFNSLDSDIKVDFCVLGGGFAGLNAAIELRLKGYDVALLEAEVIGFGASGRNGGQIIVGYSADDDFIEKYGLELAKKFWDISIDGVQLLKDRIQEFDISCDYRNGYISVSTSEKKANELIKLKEMREDFFGYESQKLINKNDLAEYVNSENYFNGVYDNFSGHFNPLKYAIGLSEIADKLGVKIFENTHVTGIKKGEILEFNTPRGNCKSRYGLIAGNVYTNEYGKILPKRIAKNIMAVGTYITVTEALEDAVAKSLIPCKAAVCDTDFQLDYYRFTPDNRLLFGGDVALGSTIPKDYINKVQARMSDVFPCLNNTKIDYMWGGHVDVTMNQQPDFGRIGNNLYYLQGFSGHGVALTGIAAKLVTHAITGEVEKYDIFSNIKHTKFYGPDWIKTPMLITGMYLHKLKELF